MVRFKNRYMVYEVVAEGSEDETKWFGALPQGLSESSVMTAVREALQLQFGDVGLGTALGTLQVKYFNPVTGACLLRCSRAQRHEVLCAIACIKEIKRKRLIMRLKHVSGNIINAQSALLMFDVTKLAKLQTEYYYGEALTKEQEQLANAHLNRLWTEALDM
eukprot:TRINITY_DN23196_c0_g1_i1.p1 TRINITY_DN23196_c0_g1~~TRINITY_DN23196_c0_g1_i1.p1  ORF type:complete len:162 (+),score=22.92 TRINITY_DN23196_c0_g1_i1:131-616(+)